jgi:hypothetical protein
MVVASVAVVDEADLPNIRESLQIHRLPVSLQSIPLPSSGSGFDYGSFP